MRIGRGFVGWLAMLVGWSVAGEGVALAQSSGFAVNRFEPSERGSHWFTLESLDFRGHLRPAVGVVGDYQYRPLAIYDQGGEPRASVVRHVATLNAGASLLLWDRARFALNVPLVVYNEGERGSLRGVAYAPPSSEQGIGDVRLGADIRLLGQYDGPAVVAAGVQMWLPTGQQEDYTSDGRVRAAPRALVAGNLGIFTYAARVAVMFRGRDNFAGSPLGHELLYGASAGVRIANERLVVGPEAFGSTVLRDATFKTRTTPFEILLGGHYTFAGGLRAGAGIGPGLTRGYGSPAVRVLASLEWSPEIVRDRDGDGVPDDEDACPDAPGARSAEPARNGCPEAGPARKDSDGDGIFDDEDACPTVPGKKTGDPRTHGCADSDGDGILDPIDACVDEPGVASEDPKLHGCPLRDRDKDGVLDKDDACPDAPGLKTDDPKTNGCPDPDRDKDGIANEADACPDQPGKAHADPKKNGCPQVFVSSTQIVIRDQVKFKTNSAEILPEKDSEESLQGVLKVLQEHPEIQKVRVEGHTDNKGAKAHNKTLSKNRAASVVKWLVAKGIDKKRLSSDGFGDEKPIDTNDTEEGRRNNRRVEFHIEASAEAAPAAK